MTGDGDSSAGTTLAQSTSVRRWLQCRPPAEHRPPPRKRPQPPPRRSLRPSPNPSCVSRVANPCSVGYSPAPAVRRRADQGPPGPAPASHAAQARPVSDARVGWVASSSAWAPSHRWRCGQARYRLFRQLASMPLMSLPGVSRCPARTATSHKSCLHHPAARLAHRHWLRLVARGTTSTPPLANSALHAAADGESVLASRRSFFDFRKSDAELKVCASLMHRLTVHRCRTHAELQLATPRVCVLLMCAAQRPFPLRVKRSVLRTSLATMQLCNAATRSRKDNSRLLSCGGSTVLGNSEAASVARQAGHPAAIAPHRRVGPSLDSGLQ